MIELADPRTSQVVLIGATRYDHLSALPAVANNLEDLRAALSDPRLWGLPPDNCHIVLDPADPTSVGRTVRLAAKAVGVEGLLLVYYAGHGLIDPADGTLILALPGCEPEVPHEAGLPYEWIRRATSASTGLRRVVILDCCYAGRASPDMAAQASAADAVADRAEIERTCLLVSASSNRPAAAPEGARHTAFTGELLRVVRAGLPGGEPLLTMDAIWREVRRELLASGHERPELRERNEGSSIPLVRNAAVRGPDLAGAILVAGPAAIDTDLNRAALLVLRHDATGAIGIRLTGRAVALPDEFSEEWRELIGEPAVVRDGGPIARDGFIAVGVLRPSAAVPLRFTPVRGRLGVISLATQPEAVRHAFTGVRIFSGYLGWGPGELEAYLDAEGLVLTDHPPSAVLSEDPAQLLWTSRPA
jgi:putative transcriptional regulator